MLKFDQLLNRAGLNRNSTKGDTAKLTIASNAAAGPDQACKSCLLLAPSSNTGAITVKNSGDAADANDCPLVQDVYMPMPVVNLSVLKFYGATDGDVVHIIWRN